MGGVALAAPAALHSLRRLHRLEGAGELAELQVQAWSLRERLSEPFELQLSALSPRWDLDLDAMLGQPVTLHTRCADGSLHARRGLVFEADASDGDGALARYRLTVRPWVALLAQRRRSQVWVQRSLVEIVDDLLADHAPRADWRWAADVPAHLAASPCADAPEGRRSSCAQHRESDLGFLQRRLAEEGLAWRMDGATMLIFADSASAQSCPAVACGGGQLRFHRAAIVEDEDAVQAFGGVRHLTSTVVTALAWDEERHRAVAASVPSAYAVGGAHSAELAAVLERYHSSGRFKTPQAAARAAELAQQALEARHKRWHGRSSVRSLDVGRSFTLSGSALDELAELAGHDARERQFVLTELIHAGLNNLPEADASAGADELARELADWVPEPVRRQAAASGYGNAFEALRARVPWRPEPPEPPPSPGLQAATVVGPQGQLSWPGQIHTDRLARLRVRMPWQDGEHRSAAASRASAWTRVAQRWAGAGHGQQFTPRVGQEVLVDFLEGDIDRPQIQGALYHGRGEAGVPPSPGGRAAAHDPSAYAASSDHVPAAQGNLTGGCSPAWHGGAPGEATPGAPAQNHAAAMSGIKTQEIDGSGHNQLVLDDSDAQLRVQLASSQHGSALNLGHLVHQADNHRGSFRGVGFELRSDAFGALRGARGVLLSSYGQQPGEAAGDATAALALARQLVELNKVFNQAASTHQATTLATHIGSTEPERSAIDAERAPAQALLHSLKGMVSEASLDDAVQDAQAKATSPGADKLPHSADPIVALAGRAGLAAVAGQDLQLAAGETVTLAAGGRLESAAQALRVHSGQSLGVLAGAVEPGYEGTQADGSGISLIAGKGDVSMQAQAGELQVAAKLDVRIDSETAHIDWAAAKSIRLATAGGASITIEGGNITVQCPGKITVRAGKKSFLGPQREHAALTRMPRGPMPYRPGKLDLRLRDVAGEHGLPLAFVPWEIVLLSAGGAIERSVLKGTSDDQGRVPLSDEQQQELIKLCSQRPEGVWLHAHGDMRPLWMFAEDPDWGADRRAAEAMAGLDYSDDTHRGLGPGAPAQDESVARTDKGCSAHALWPDLKQT